MHDSSDGETIVEWLDDDRIWPTALSLTSEDTDATFDFMDKFGMITNTVCGNN